MGNRHRGDVTIVLAGERLTLRLTLGALAEIEDALGVESLSGLGERFTAAGLKTRDLIALLGAAARGGGTDLSDADLAARVPASDLPALAQALTSLLAATFGEAPPPDPPLRRR